MYVYYKYILHYVQYWKKKTIVNWELLTTTSSLSKVQFEVF